MDSKWSLGWSKVEKVEGGGRYPLGLNRFHSGLEDLLIKSTTELANRLRYITYYCWSIGDIHKSDDNLQYRDFVNSFCKRENALAIGLHILKPSYSYNGKDNSYVASSPERDDCSVDFQLMKSNHLGAFGLYYVGTIQNLGLVEINTSGVYSLTSKGMELYDLYDRFLQNKQPQYYVQFKGRNIIPSKVLLEWGQTNDLSNIKDDSCQKERDFYKSLLFRLDKKQTLDFRRHTLCLFLEAIDQCKKTNTVKYPF